MGLFFRRLFWFVLVVASGFVATLLGATQYGIKFDLNSWAKMSGLHEISGVTDIINRVPELLNLPMIQSYGFYGSLATFLIFLLIFTMSLRSGRNHKAETGDAPNNNTQAAVDADNKPNRFSETRDESSDDSDIVAETNSDAIVGTDGEIYDGTATFSGADTYSNIDPMPEDYALADYNNERDDEDEDEIDSDLAAHATISAADDSETELSHLTDAELKSKTLDCAEEMRSFEADYQNDRDEAASELNEFSNSEGMENALQNVEHTYEHRQTVYSSEFEKKFRPEAVAIRHEIAKRLGMSEPYEDFSPALDQGMLVGANPVTDAADLIEELVKKLA